MTRNDVHAPSNLVTEDYVFVTCFDNEPPQAPLMGGAFAMQAWAEAMAWYRNESQRLNAMVRTSETGSRGLRQCHHCGARFRYLAVMLHVPSGTHIAIGETCLDNRFELASTEFHTLRKENKLDSERRKVAEQVAKFVEDNEDLFWLATMPNHYYANKYGEAAMAAFNEACPEQSRENWFVADVARKLVNYGTISERQADAVRRSIVKDVELAARKAAREAEAAEAGPVPAGSKVDVAGTVVGRKLHESDFGCSWKLTVKLANGSRIWFTEPSNFTAQVGDEIECRLSTVTASDKDATFGFGKRPTRFSVTKAAEEVTA